MAAMGRNMAGPLLFLNLVMYLIVLGFASWCLNRFINGQTNHPSFGGNGATFFFLIFSILAAVVGVASKLAGANHIRAWRSDSLAAAASSSLIAWAITALAMGLACKQIRIGGHRGWRLRVVEAFIILLTMTQLLYLALLHAGVFGSKYGPGYKDSDYPASAADPAHKPTAAARIYNLFFYKTLQQCRIIRYLTEEILLKKYYSYLGLFLFYPILHFRH